VLLSLACSSASIDGEVVACREDGTPGTLALYSGNESKMILQPAARRRLLSSGPLGLVPRVYFVTNSRAMRTESPEVDMKIRASVTTSIERRKTRIIGPRDVRFFSA
jgi:hypothetical protein